MIFSDNFVVQNSMELAREYASLVEISRVFKGHILAV